MTESDNRDWVNLQGSFGDRLLAERKRLEITQETFAEMAHVKRVDQHLYEQNIRLPDVEYLYRVQAMGINVCYLIYGERCSHGGVPV
jgi:transcriptional regulator with XRE-family HTH domain